MKIPTAFYALVVAIAFASGIPSVSSAHTDFSHYDRYLTGSELQTLLPLYVDEIQRTASVQPSPRERKILRNIAFAAEDTTTGYFVGGRFVGRKSWTAEEIRRFLARSYQELAQVTPEERRADTFAFVQGFSNPAVAGRITCQLGYAGPGTSETARIVKCVDDRSSGGNNGFADRRIFVMSVDPQTLAPFNVLDMDHLQAG